VKTRDFLFSASILALGHTHLLVQWIPVIPPELKELVHEGSQSPPSSTTVKNAWTYTSTPLYNFMVW
jgi:hypothetical protein